VDFQQAVGRYIANR